MDSILFLLGIIVLVAVAGAFFVMANWEDVKAAADAEKGRIYSERIEEIFYQIWNGEEVSRAAAWYRTVEHLRHGDYPHEMVTEAEMRLLMLEQGRANGRRSDYTVNSNGRLVHITELGGSDKPGPVGV